MDWKIFNEWRSLLLKTEYKDNLISKTVGELNRVLSDQISNSYFQSELLENKHTITNKNWELYGKINNLLDKIQKKYFKDTDNLYLPRMSCKSTQKCHRKDDINKVNMYNISAECNGINTLDKDIYFYIPIHKTRRHIHGVPSDFLIDYIYNMIETATWEKNCHIYYIDHKYIKDCAVYQCPEKYEIKNDKNIKKEIKCLTKISVISKLQELEIYLTKNEIEKIKIFFQKKKIINFRLNFPSKIRYITYCIGSRNCKHSNGLIHFGIPSVKQYCDECKITYCRECGKIPFHTNQICNIEDLKRNSNIDFENPEQYRKCPGCDIWIEKEEGCDHIRCMCGVHFCYKCRTVLCANDPYYHRCNMDGADPHFRDFPLNHPDVQYSGEISCKCLSCRTM
jgi:hypothetical protein